MTGAGDRVQTQFVGLAFGVFSIGNDADGLAFHVMQMGFTSAQVKGDVVHTTDRSFAQQAVVLGDRANKRSFWLVEVDRYGLMSGVLVHRCFR